mgnify:CR=1 FL=1
MKKRYVLKYQKIEFSFKFPSKEIKTKSECIPKDNNKENENIKT